jgi:peptide/nickel transport system substrate-binding protein
MQGRIRQARRSLRSAIGGLIFCMVASVAAAQAAADTPAGAMRWALYVTLSPSWFEPGEVAGFLTPFWVLYALHDALLKPMPGNLMAPSLAESWSVSEDHRTYEFRLRRGLTFHNGDPFTAEDVRFSFWRYKGSKLLHDKVRDVEVVDPHRVRFHLKAPWPDFLTFYGTLATGAAWIVPKRYVEQVGDEGFKKHPIGLGPYRFVSHTPGVELVMEAFEGYWRKVPHVKRLVFKSVPEATTRMAMLKKGEVDLAYLLPVPLAEEVKRDPKLRLAFSGGVGTHWLEFFEQWDPKSPWHDRRVRLAASYAIDRQGLSEAETLGASKPTGNLIPRHFEFALPIEAHPYDPARAQQLLAEAGYPQGFDAGELTPIPPYLEMGEAVGNYLGAVGIRVRVRPMERAAFFAAWRGKQLRGLCLCASGAYGNAATRLAEFVVSTGTYAYGGYADIDALFAQQAEETARGKREALLHQIQRLAHERVMVAPIWEYIWPSGVGPRVEEPALGLTPLYPWSAPLEEGRLKPE